ncbi:MAG TPA: SDR family NAD(P)-dependent oxidoreductase [Alphaproteobacteria bacterium]|nr:SDR family NAD(P)-dependent oxidoreductase [Alphaproteobacteria bacterium]
MTDVRKVAVVTGGAAGIGFEIVRHLAGEGMAVLAADRDEAACVRARDSLKDFAGQVKIIAADIGTAEGARAAVESAIEVFGRIDLLCNNAAAHPFEMVEGHDLASWRETFRVNVDGTMLCSQAALPHMRRQGGGSIVNIGSVSGILSYAGGSAYAASKAAVAMFTKTLALEAGPDGIRVNCICPGTIRHRAARDSDEEKPAHIPLGRAGTSADVAHLVSFLASDAASYMSGAIIALDGGATAGRPRVSKRRAP